MYLLYIIIIQFFCLGQEEYDLRMEELGIVTLPWTENCLLGLRLTGLPRLCKGWVGFIILPFPWSQMDLKGFLMALGDN